MRNAFNYIHRPKNVSLVCVACALLALIVCHFLFSLVESGLLDNNIDFLLAMHLIIFASFPVLIVAAFSFLLQTIELNCKRITLDKRVTIISMLRVIDLFFAIAIGMSLFFFIQNYQGAVLKNARYEFRYFLSGTIYFRMITTKEAISVLYELWEYFLLILSGCICVVFVKAYNRKERIIIPDKKKIKKNADNAKRDATLGYNYDESTFYKQTQIPYVELKQEDGTYGEFRAFDSLIRAGFDEEHIFLNREIPKEDGLFTESDLILIHENGILVIENKHYTTRIFGKATDSDLTIIDHTGAKKSIYNPIQQNEKHVVALCKYLSGFGLYTDALSTPVHSIVVFTTSHSDNTDSVISGIDVSNSKSVVCTSGNLSFVAKRLLTNGSDVANIDVTGVSEVLSTLSIRKKW